jgi:hypothetical protein
VHSSQFSTPFKEPTSSGPAGGHIDDVFSAQVDNRISTLTLFTIPQDFVIAALGRVPLLRHLITDVLGYQVYPALRSMAHLETIEFTLLQTQVDLMWLTEAVNSLVMAVNWIRTVRDVTIIMAVNFDAETKWIAQLVRTSLALVWNVCDNKKVNLNYMNHHYESSV